MMIQLLSRTFVPFYFVLQLTTSACAVDGPEVIAKAYAEKMKVRSADYKFTSKMDTGTVLRFHLVFEGKKVFLEQEVLEKGILAENTSVADEILGFDGSVFFASQGSSVRSYNSTTPRNYQSPLQVTFSWLVEAMTLGRDAERLSEWEHWAEFASKVVDVSEDDGGIVRLRAEKLPIRIDYVDVFFDPAKNFYPIKYDFYRDGRCIVSANCKVQSFQSERGETVVFPIFAEYRQNGGPGSINSWIAHEVDPASVKINPRISDKQFTTAALPSRKVIDVDAMNKRLGGTLDDRIGSAFAVAGTSLERHQRSLEVIKLVKQRLLVVFGEPSDERVRRLMDIRFNDKDFETLSDDFLCMAIPTTDERMGDAEPLARLLGESLSADRDKLLLVILDESGTKLGATEAAGISVDGKLDKERLIEFLSVYKIEPVDARKLLDSAMARAKSENKRVIVQETATWCGPCHQLTRFLNSNRIWEKDYLLVKMDRRWTGARELMENMRNGAKGGIPWFAILDAEEQVLATSNQTDSGENIGFPSDESSIAHFEAMLNATRTKLSKNEVSDLIAALKQLQEP